jgi:hypothetical protein
MRAEKIENGAFPYFSAPIFLPASEMKSSLNIPP